MQHATALNDLCRNTYKCKYMLPLLQQYARKKDFSAIDSLPHTHTHAVTHTLTHKLKRNAMRGMSWRSEAPVNQISAQWRGKAHNQKAETRAVSGTQDINSTLTVEWPAVILARLILFCLCFFLSVCFFFACLLLLCFHHFDIAKAWQDIRCMCCKQAKNRCKNRQ